MVRGSCPPGSLAWLALRAGNRSLRVTAQCTSLQEWGPELPLSKTPESVSAWKHLLPRQKWSDWSGLPSFWQDSAEWKQARAAARQPFRDGKFLMGSTSYFPLKCLYADSYLMLYFENKINVLFMQMVLQRGYASRLKFCKSFTFRWCFWLGQNALDTQLLLQSSGTSTHRQTFSYSAVPLTAWIPMQLRYVNLHLSKPLPKCFLSA